MFFVVLCCISMVALRVVTCGILLKCEYCGKVCEYNAGFCRKCSQMTTLCVVIWDFTLENDGWYSLLVAKESVLLEPGYEILFLILIILFFTKDNTI